MKIFSRLIRNWLGQPLLDINKIIERQDKIDWFFNNNLIRQKVISLLGNIADLERLINRVRNGIAISRDLIALRSSLEKLEEVRDVYLLFYLDNAKQNLGSKFSCTLPKL